MNYNTAGKPQFLPPRVDRHAGDPVRRGDLWIPLPRTTVEAVIEDWIVPVITLAMAVIAVAALGGWLDPWFEGLFAIVGV